MALSNRIEPVTALRSRSAELIRRAQDAQAPIIITQNGRATAVLQDIASWEERERALALLKIAHHAEGAIARGELSEHEDVAAAVAELLDDGSGG